MADIRAFGRLPRRTHGNKAEYELADRLRRAKRQDLLSESQVAELEAMPKYDPERERADRLNTLMPDIRASGWGGDADPAERAELRGELKRASAWSAAALKRNPGPAFSVPEGVPRPRIKAFVKAFTHLRLFLRGPR